MPAKKITNYLPFLCLLFWTLPVLAQVKNLESPVQFKAVRVSIAEALRLLAEENQLNIAFSDKLFDPAKRISISYEQASLETVLNAILKNTAVKYRFQHQQLVLFQEREVFAPLKKFTVNGYVAEESNGEKLMGVNIFHRVSGKWATTNEYGFYSITIPEGENQLSYSYLGCEEQLINLRLQESTRLDIQLKSASTLTEVIVTPTMDSLGTNTLVEDGHLMPPNYVTLAPGIGGEVDILNMATTLPGIQTGADGFGGMFIRGGEAGQNLILLDGVPVYNSGHLLGVFSVFNTDAIRSARLLKGRFPARYGGRVSSIFEINGKEGNQKKWTAEAGSGLISAKAKVEGPLFRKNGGLLLTARRSHSPFLMDKVLVSDLFPGNGDYQYYFYDINAKLHVAVSDKDRLFLSFYSGKDRYKNKSEQSGMFVEVDPDEFGHFKTVEESVLDWSNDIAALRWNRIWGAKLFSNTTLTYSDYNYQNSNLFELEATNFTEFESIRFFSDQRSGIKDYSVKTDVDYLPGGKHQFRFGAALTKHQLSPYSLGIEQNFDATDSLGFMDLINQYDERIDTGLEWALYAEDQYQLSELIRIDAGLRYSAYLGKRGDFFDIEPRLNLIFQPNSLWSFQGGFSKMSQYLQQVPTSGFSLPGDIWLGVSDKEPPLRSWLFEAGATRTITKELQLSVDAYYKRMDNILTAENLGTNGTIIINDDFSVDGLLAGKGRSYGVELLLQKTGKTGGWLSYTLAKATHQFDGLYNGRTFDFRFDRAHTINIFAYHQLHKHWYFSVNWKFGSPSEKIQLEQRSAEGILFGDPNEPTDPLPLRTLERGISYHRLDANINYTRRWKNTRHEFKLGATNLYNRQNPSYYLVGYKPNGRLVVRPVNLLGFTPSFYYAVGF